MALVRPASETLAYIAGLIDGEGSIGLMSGGSKKVDGETAVWKPLVSICSSCLSLLESVQRDLGCGFIIKSKSRGWNKRPVYRWQIRTRAIRVYLPQIAPFLRLKRERANLLIEACRLLETRGNRRHLADLAVKIRSHKMWGVQE